jgi:hypothetical protein
MTDTEYRTWLEEEVAAGKMSREQLEDLLAQKTCFESNRPEIEQSCVNKVVAYVAGQRLVGETLPEVVGRARKNYPDRMVYLESVGFSLISETLN